MKKLVFAVALALTAIGSAPASAAPHCKTVISNGWKKQYCPTTLGGMTFNDRRLTMKKPCRPGQPLLACY
jgi:hypothetical protein